MEQNAQGRGDEVGTFSWCIGAKFHSHGCFSGKKIEQDSLFSRFYDSDHFTIQDSTESVV